MQKLIRTLEDIMVAITFAEAGEYDEAKKLSVQEQEGDKVLSSDRLKTTEA